jgi:hypothetical protein
MVDLVTADAARQDAVTRKTHEDEARAWRRWIEYAKSIGITQDFFLDGLTRPQRIKIMGAFAMAMREGRFLSQAHDTLAETTIRNTISSISSTFRENERANPTKDEDGKLGRLLSRLFRAFKNKDPAEKQQKALPATVLVEISKLQLTETQKAISQLTIGAFYFAMRSCEYVKVPQAQKRRTDILRKRNLTFLKKGKIIPHDSPELEYADCLTITFEFQKKDEKNDSVTMHATGHITMCPVRAWAALIRRIMTYHGNDDNTPVSAVWKNNRIEHITSKQIIDAINMAAEAIGWESLGIKKGDFGTHSIRSGGAMAMYLDEVPVFTIMMIGRWSSDAFLKYIRKQVESFSHNIAKRMNKHMHFRHIPLVD